MRQIKRLSRLRRGRRLFSIGPWSPGVAERWGTWGTPPDGGRGRRGQVPHGPGRRRFVLPGRLPAGTWPAPGRLPAGPPRGLPARSWTFVPPAGGTRVQDRAVRQDERMTIGTLVLLRHGESEWNAKNLFTGWV